MSVQRCNHRKAAQRVDHPYRPVGLQLFLGSIHVTNGQQRLQTHTSKQLPHALCADGSNLARQARQFTDVQAPNVPVPWQPAPKTRSAPGVTLANRIAFCKSLRSMRVQLLQPLLELVQPPCV